MPTFKTGTTVMAAALLVSLAGCGTAETASEEPQSPTATTSTPIQETDWMRQHFSSAPYFAQYARVNPQAYRPDNGRGVPLPTDVADDAVVWQLPACVVSPFTAHGPRDAEVKDGYVALSGWAHNEQGAAAAAEGLLNSAGDSANQDAAVAHATGLSAREAQRLVATTPRFATTTPRFNESPSVECGAKIDRSTAWKVVEYYDSSAVIDLFSPISSAETGIVIRVSLEWKDGDWKLNPTTFAAFDRLADDLADTGGTGRSVDLTEYTQW